TVCEHLFINTTNPRSVLIPHTHIEWNDERLSFLCVLVFIQEHTRNTLVCVSHLLEDVRLNLVYMFRLGLLQGLELICVNGLNLEDVELPSLRVLDEIIKLAPDVKL